MSTLLGVVPLAVILTAACIHWLTDRIRAHPGWATTLIMAAVTGAIAWLARGVLAGHPVSISLSWFPALGIRYALILDGLALLFAGLIAGVGLLVAGYSVAYMPREPELGRFYAYLLVFTGAMLGVVLADDLILLCVFWELTSLASFFLIGYRHESAAARAAATQALIVTVIGGVAMLAGFVLLAQAGGTWQISSLVGRTAQVTADPRAPAIVALVLAGAFTKSAQAPFQFWLPSAMVAPTPVSTYLHAATMVWAGVYLLARLLPVLGGVVWWSAVIVPVGLVTLLTGTGLALAQNDLKALLAYSTVGALGLATALIGWGTPAAVFAAMAYVINHGAFKGALFLVVGAVEHAAGTRTIDRLRGLGRVMPITTAVAGVGALAMAALPPLGGFLGKDAAVRALLSDSAFAGGVVMVAGALSLAYTARLMKIFTGPPSAQHAREPSPLLWMPPAVLAGFALLFGVAPGLVEQVAGAATAAIAPAGAVRVGLWHGVTATTALITGITVAGGFAALALAPRFIGLGRPLAWASSGLAYDRLYQATLHGSKRLTGWYMTGRARDYYAYVILFAVALLGYGIASTGIVIPPSVGGVEPGPLISVAIAIIAALAAARLGLLVAAILALGVTGYSISVVYLLLSAPDIAITQAVVETISLILFLVALTALARAEPDQQPRPISDAGLAVAAGGISIIVAGMIENVSRLPRVAEQFIAHAGEAGGKNVVNLVVVDFRGWDTMGEISVLAIAALGIMALAPWRRRHPATAHGSARGSRHTARVPPHAAEAPMSSVILRTVASVVSPIIIAYAVLLWATGHYGPGGGFVAGLMFAAAMVLRAEAFGIRRLDRRWDLLMIAGLLLAVGSAAAPLAVGAPLLEHTLLVIGSRTFASSLIFDLGVFCLVAGATLTAVRSLSEAA